MKTYTSIIAVLAFAAMTSSCAVGRKMSFENKQAELGFTPTQTATIVFQDKREEVLSGKEKPSFCGHSNSSMQISYNIQTNSGNPLADEFAGSVNSSYSSGGLATNTMLVTMNTYPDSVLQAFKAGNTDRLLYFTMYKWESRATPLAITIRYEVIYKLELKVFDKTGSLLATEKTQDIITKEEGAATSMKKMQAMADDVFKQQVKALLGADAIKKYL